MLSMKPTYYIEWPMEPPFSNECPKHNLERNYCCQYCGILMCLTCLPTHKRHNLKNPFYECINESLFSNFKFDRCLGKGSFGSVFRVQSFWDDQIYALKVIEDADKESVKLIQKQITLMTQIKHENILIYNWCNWISEKEIVCLAMDMCDGNLDTYIIYPMNEKTALGYFKQICNGVRALHQDYKIIHGNLKLENILIKEKIIKLSDFGETRKFKDSINIKNNKRLGTLGKYEYLAPEIFKNKNVNFDEKTDIWSLGIILYKMLTKNVHPFLNATEENLIPTIMYEDLKIHPSIQNPILRRILLGCLEKSPEKRMNINELIVFLISNENGIKIEDDIENSKVPINTKKRSNLDSILPENAILGYIASVTINRNDLSSLNDGNWVSDNAILGLLSYLKSINIITGVIIPPTIFMSLMRLEIEEAQIHLTNEYIDQNNSEIIIPLNQGTYHWILLRLLREQRIIEIYDPYQTDKCEEEIKFIMSMERFFGRVDFRKEVKTNFPKQTDSYNCGIIILEICHKHFDLHQQHWGNYDNSRRFYREMLEKNLSYAIAIDQ